MGKKTFFKACLRSIRGSFSRFLAIFLIVALGAGFLAGLLATTPDMRHTISALMVWRISGVVASSPAKKPAPSATMRKIARKRLKLPRMDRRHALKNVFFPIRSSPRAWDRR